MFNDITSLEEHGFEKFDTVEALMKNNCELIPTKPGVYLAVNSDREKFFLDKSVGGHFKGKDPSVSISELQSNWVESAIVLYIGQTTRTLQERVKEYMEFGQGKPVGHWGGRLIWQLANNRQLVICGKVLPDPKPEGKMLIAEFTQQYGKRPFANLKG